MANKYIYGTCRGARARKHVKDGTVEFVLWEAGQQGNDVDFWYAFHPDWWKGFIPDAVQPKRRQKLTKWDWWLIIGSIIISIISGYIWIKYIFN